MRLNRIAAVLLALAVLAGCAGPSKNASVHKSIAGKTEQPMPRKMMLLPPDIRVHEVSAGGVVEKVDDWTATANAHAMKSVREIGSSKKLFELQDTPALAPPDKDVLDQHLALYELVAGSADFSRSGPFAPWRERAQNFDYTLGPGLKGLGERSDMDAALIIIGSDYISSAGRKATMALGVLASALLGVAVIPQGGISFVSVGMVDLRSGDLLWFSTNRGPQNDLREEDQVRGILERLFQEYPGIELAKTADAAR
jgi:hypothetical protein